MNKAVNKAYISGRKLEQYKRERELQQQQQHSSDLPVFQEALMEESHPDLGGLLKNAADDVQMKEEAKYVFKSKKDIAKQ